MRVNVIKRENFVPRIAYNAELKIAVPNRRRNAQANEPGRHMTVEAPRLCHEMAPGRNRPEGETQDLRDRVGRSFVIARLMSLDRRKNGSKHVVRAAMLRKEYFNTRARGFHRFHEYELVFVRNDHS